MAAHTVVFSRLSNIVFVVVVVVVVCLLLFFQTGRVVVWKNCCVYINFFSLTPFLLIGPVVLVRFGSPLMFAPL